MRHLLDSCRIEQFPASVRQLAASASMTLPLSLKAFIQAPGCFHSRCVRIHLKFLKEGSGLNDSLRKMRLVFKTADIGVTVASREYLSGPAFDSLLDLDVANGVTITAEMEQLFSNRNFVVGNDVVLYFVRTLSLGAAGLATRSRGVAMLEFWTSGWTLAHELGHVLGPDHPTGEQCSSPPCAAPISRLMTGCGTACIEGMATLTPDEIAMMRSSPFTSPCGQ